MIDQDCPPYIFYIIRSSCSQQYQRHIEGHGLMQPSRPRLNKAEPAAKSTTSHRNSNPQCALKTTSPREMQPENKDSISAEQPIEKHFIKVKHIISKIRVPRNPKKTQASKIRYLVVLEGHTEKIWIDESIMPPHVIARFQQEVIDLSSSGQQAPNEEVSVRPPPSATRNLKSESNIKSLKSLIPQKADLKVALKSVNNAHRGSEAPAPQKETKQQNHEVVQVIQDSNSSLSIRVNSPVNQPIVPQEEISSSEAALQIIEQASVVYPTVEDNLNKSAAMDSQSPVSSQSEDEGQEDYKKYLKYSKEQQNVNQNEKSRSLSEGSSKRKIEAPEAIQILSSRSDHQMEDEYSVDLLAEIQSQQKQAQVKSKKRGKKDGNQNKIQSGNCQVQSKSMAPKLLKPKPSANKKGSRAPVKKKGRIVTRNSKPCVEKKSTARRLRRPITKKQKKPAIVKKSNKSKLVKKSQSTKRIRKTPNTLKKIPEADKEDEVSEMSPEHDEPKEKVIKNKIKPEPTINMEKIMKEAIEWEETENLLVNYVANALMIDGKKYFTLKLHQDNQSMVIDEASMKKYFPRKLNEYYMEVINRTARSTEGPNYCLY